MSQNEQSSPEKLKYYLGIVIIFLILIIIIIPLENLGVSIATGLFAAVFLTFIVPVSAFIGAIFYWFINGEKMSYLGFFSKEFIIGTIFCFFLEVLIFSTVKLLEIYNLLFVSIIMVLIILGILIYKIN